MKHKLQAVFIGLGFLGLILMAMTAVITVVVLLMVYVSYWTPIVLIVGAMTLLIAYALGDEFLKGRKNGR